MPDLKLPATSLTSGAALWQWRQQSLAQVATSVEPTPKQPAAEQAAPNWQRELDWLLQSVSDLDALSLRLETYRQQAAIPLRFSLEQLDQLWQQRLIQRMPLQYLLGRAAWRDFDLQVSPAVLIPRPETEQIIDLALAAHLQESAAANPSHWADLGTGSGAIALGLALAFPAATIHAVDISAAALQVARANMTQCSQAFSQAFSSGHGLEQRLQFYQGSWFEPLAAWSGQFTGIIANPPYIPSATVADLQPEVVRHEPHLALDGGPDGLTCLRTIIQTAPAYLRPGGILLLEMMQGQDQAVQALIQQTGQYQAIQIHPDLAGINRFAHAQRLS
jgi:release factor glutamine methyltransferase